MFVKAAAVLHTHISTHAIRDERRERRESDIYRERERVSLD